ncbi:hypothetical protein K1T71_005793 [Dendrolimus kikuchii]|uniref:Uncharacterized protein n=1 Tax=Dendrolimus kikuchii TaxID=765133 RepID=A0ACC1D516_9NEOP|nr:hypothetical protein K1T71_005793 [Dendrolimus kikuchii]
MTTMLKIGGAAGFLVVNIFIVVTQGQDPDLETLEHAGRQYIFQLDADRRVIRNLVIKAEWDYFSNYTKENQEKWIDLHLELLKHVKQASEEIKMYKWQDYQDFNLRRMFKKYSQIGILALPDEKFKVLTSSITDMSSNYVNAKICAYNNKSKCKWASEIDITDIFAKSRDPEELKYTWAEWHKEAGAKSRDNFTTYLDVYNEAAKLNKFKDASEEWQSNYEMPDFESQLAKVWKDVKPLYQQLHAYVRKRLRDKYGDDVVSAKGPIPAHLLGSISVQNWSNIESFTRPYPDKNEVDVTQAMKDQNYTPLKMFQMSDAFFKSLNLTAMPEKFWKKSIIEKPTDREILCYTSISWDFYDGEDFRVKQCTTVDYQNLLTTHQEMGRIQYYLQYRHQPYIFRDGASRGFHEAIADTIVLSISSPKHLHRVHLLESDVEDEQTKINRLYKTVINKLVLLPVEYMIDLFRYDAFRKTTTPENYNCHYWRLREMLQGVEPPVNRTEEYFDPAAIFQVAANMESVRYYVSYIIQFQFHRALCLLAGEYVPGDLNKKLSDCDIYQSVAAGNTLGNMLKMGSSKPWPDAMEVLTGQREMRAEGLLEYFKPLYEWLKTENQRTGEYIGWESSRTQFCTAQQIAALNVKQTDKSEAQMQETIQYLYKVFGFALISSVFVCYSSVDDNEDCRRASPSWGNSLGLRGSCSW